MRHPADCLGKAPGQGPLAIVALYHRMVVLLAEGLRATCALNMIRSGYDLPTFARDRDHM